MAWAKRIFTTENLKLAVIGKSEDKAGLEKLVRHREEESLARYRRLVPRRLPLDFCS